MACGSCGGKKQNVDYEVTFRDGSTKVVDSLPAVRMAINSDTSVDPDGRRKVPTYKPVPRK